MKKNILDKISYKLQNKIPLTKEECAIWNAASVAMAVMAIKFFKKYLVEKK